MSDVWAVIHHVNRTGGDVAVASNRSDDPGEWERAHHGALRNMHACQREAQRWSQIADEMAAAQQAASFDQRALRATNRERTDHARDR